MFGRYKGAALAFVLLNPSTADETREDATFRRCIGFARAHGYGGLEVVNLYAYVATDPADLRRAGYPVGRLNDRHIEDAMRESERVVLAWGVHAAKLERPRKVLALLREMGAEPWCLRGDGDRAPGAPAAAACGVRAAGVRAGSGKSGKAREPVRHFVCEA